MPKDYDTLVDDIFLDLEKVTYRAFSTLNSQDMLAFADRLRQVSDTFYAKLYRNLLNLDFEKLVADELIKEE